MSNWPVASTTHYTTVQAVMICPVLLQCPGQKIICNSVNITGFCQTADTTISEGTTTAATTSEITTAPIGMTTVRTSTEGTTVSFDNILESTTSKVTSVRTSTEGTTLPSGTTLQRTMSQVTTASIGTTIIDTTTEATTYTNTFHSIKKARVRRLSSINCIRIFH